MIECGSAEPKLHNYHILFNIKDLAIDEKVEGRAR